MGSYPLRKPLPAPTTPIAPIPGTQYPKELYCDCMHRWENVPPKAIFVALEQEICCLYHAPFAHRITMVNCKKKTNPKLSLVNLNQIFFFFFFFGSELHNLMSILFKFTLNCANTRFYAGTQLTQYPFPTGTDLIGKHLVTILVPNHEH